MATVNLRYRSYICGDTIPFPSCCHRRRVQPAATMSQESSATNPLSQDTFDYLWHSIADVTEQGEYTQLSTKDITDYHYSDMEEVISEVTSLQVEK